MVNTGGPKWNIGRGQERLATPMQLWPQRGSLPFAEEYVLCSPVVFFGNLSLLETCFFLGVEANGPRGVATDRFGKGRPRNMFRFGQSDNAQGVTQSIVLTGSLIIRNDCMD